jgi:hypothetical protein
MPINSTRSILFRACPRCHGDLVLDSEEAQELHGELYYVCLQCGRGKWVQTAKSATKPTQEKVAA